MVKKLILFLIPTSPMIAKDKLWKAIIEDLIEDFFHFFFAEYVHLIDFEHGFEFLDKELQQLFPESESSHRHADKLIKVKLLNGSELWFLVHVEVQGYKDERFDRRMFEYGYRIEDRYPYPLTALAIYTDANRATHFKEYRRAFFGTEHIYRFNTYALIDHPVDELQKIDNPFALVMQTAWMTIRRKPKDPKLLDLKRNLIRSLLERKYSKQKISAVFEFIRHYAHFTNSDFSVKFEHDIELITQPNKPMGIQEAILQEVKKEGIAIGEAKGIEKGIEQGIEKGIEQGIEIGESIGADKALKSAIAQLLQKGFSAEETIDLLNAPEEKVIEVLSELANENLPNLLGE